MAYQAKAKILKNSCVGGNYFKMEISCPRVSKSALSGQFVNLKISDRFIPLLRRPISIHNVRGSKIELLYEVVGKGTELLSRKKAGEELDLIGPLGNSFSYVAKRTPILVAGGMGVAPLVFLADKLKKQKPLVLVGAKTKKQILCVKEFEKIGCAVKTATDDGSVGFKGRVTDMLKNLLSTIDYRQLTLYACGPKPMLKAVSVIAKIKNIPAQVSLEEHMACGIGACLGCVVNTKKGMKRVCKEGLVFDSGEIIW
ncbi:MAG: dihydroorotate dehydrogenase electron transfer subunit [Candidatus Omnitrophica bacterium]|nr:dihydroorotate dehydrogenase electron transfer subunit [Candidatus Omnitrophota bacterium]